MAKGKGVQSLVIDLEVEGEAVRVATESLEKGNGTWEHQAWSKVHERRKEALDETVGKIKKLSSDEFSLFKKLSKKFEHASEYLSKHFNASDSVEAGGEVSESESL